MSALVYGVGLYWKFSQTFQKKETKENSFLRDAKAQRIDIHEDGIRRIYRKNEGQVNKDHNTRVRKLGFRTFQKKGHYDP